MKHYPKNPKECHHCIIDEDSKYFRCDYYAYDTNCTLHFENGHTMCDRLYEEELKKQTENKKMKKYIYTIVEELRKDVIIEAPCEEIAFEILQDKYNAEEYILSAEDFSSVEFYFQKEVQDEELGDSK